MPFNSTNISGHIYPKPTHGVSSADAQIMINFSSALLQRHLLLCNFASYSKDLAVVQPNEQVQPRREATSAATVC